MNNLENIRGIQLSVKFNKDDISANFESSNKKAVDWDSITDEQYECMMDVAIIAIKEIKKQHNKLKD